MKFILVNLYAAHLTTLEDLLDNNILKELGYSAKFDNDMFVYDNILVPFVEDDSTDVDYLVLKDLINVPEKYKYSIYQVFRDVLPQFNHSMTFNINREITDEQFGIFYTDGSFSKNNNKASYGCCKLLSESDEGTLDSFTGKKFLYETFNGATDVATNNVGELTGIKVAIENFNDKTYQLIISDSIYSIKSFREWIYNWQKNGYRSASKKEIKNKELIVETFKEIKDSKKIIIYKWTKGHDDDQFNEICDQLAKQISGGK